MTLDTARALTTSRVGTSRQCATAAAMDNPCVVASL